MQVQVSRVDLDGRRIDFRLVSGNDDAVLRAMRDKTGGEGAPDQGGGRRLREREERAQAKAAPRESTGPGKGTTAKGGGRNKEARGAARGGAGKTRKGRR